MFKKSLKSITNKKRKAKKFYLISSGLEMHLTCSQKKLAGALAIISKAVDLNNTLPVLNNVLLKAEKR